MSDTKMYFCLSCQKVAGMDLIRKGVHAGHPITEFDGMQNEPVSVNALMRAFREKVEAARRYRDLLFKRHF